MVLKAGNKGVDAAVTSPIPTILKRKAPPFAVDLPNVIFTFPVPVLYAAPPSVQAETKSVLSAPILLPAVIEILADELSIEMAAIAKSFTVILGMVRVLDVAVPAVSPAASAVGVV